MQAIRESNTRLATVIACAIATALARIAVLPIAMPEVPAFQAQAKATPHDFNFTHSAFLVNGKGKAYKTYTSYPFDKSAVIHKARIKDGKLHLTGTISHNGKRVKVKDKAYKLTSKTKYYKHVGNGSFYEKSSKKKLAKLMSAKNSGTGGGIYLIVKKGKVTVLAAQ